MLCDVDRQCGISVVPFSNGGDNPELRDVGLSEATDNSTAARSGDIYFYSPEVLVPSNAVANGRNLYVRRESGQIQLWRLWVARIAKRSFECR